MSIPLPASLKQHIKQAIEVVAPQILQRKYLADFGRDEAEVVLLDLLVPQGCEAIDVGANWGIYSTALAPLCSHVHCLEPHPRLARILRRSLPANCTIEEVAASDTEGVAVLEVPLLNGSPAEGLGSIRGMGLADSRRVEVRTIALGKYRDRPIGFVKIDVEGGEQAALQGARALIEQRHPAMLIELEERHKTNAVGWARAYLEQFGYEGWFCQAGRLHAIDAFDVDLHQGPDALRALGVDPVRRYINNFIFSPSGMMTAERRTAIERRLNGVSPE